MAIHHHLRLLLGASLLAFGGVTAAAPAFAVEMKSGESFSDVAARVRNSVVSVSAQVTEKLGGSSARRSRGEGSRGPKQGQSVLQKTSVGSGFIIDASGIIVTNNHVIEDGNTVFVVLPDGSEVKVDRVIGRDTKTDIAVLKITPRASKPLTPVSFGDSSRMRIGDWVIAVGNPFGFKGSVTAGILSGRGRDISAGPYDDFLQTDASINSGNSGGPLFNARGDVIGINTAIFSPSGGSIGLGFAIPSNTAKRIVEQLRKHGEIRWGWIGARLQTPSDDIAEHLHLDHAEGALIARVDKGSPAEAAGLQEGDVVLAFAGTSVKHARQLPRFIAQSNVGEDADVLILRNGERKTVKVKVGRMIEADWSGALPLSQQKAKRQKLGKISFAPLSDDLRSRLGLSPDAEGAVVSADESRVVALGNLNPGDIVIGAAHAPVRTADDLEQRLTELRALSRSEATLTVRDASGAIRFESVSLDQD
ncbi:trypsin-like peptidase domain-containing protein [Rhodomicrobium vannielii ATCC 17100]|uniref:trypsin-like peptidase domain-containing protein n=1 Tax=Rhodomicrobium vannielii TaxID=1069 RepID=UPI0019190625|nr:trypsin-like peptidase domain-containing protein [Rhodomicrobium vannielii]MBJ7534449.1 trypsin-like peptidase domain-containing protein [Rhodomicrobium vannielii ATCC 17100]